MDNVTIRIRNSDFQKEDKKYVWSTILTDSNNRYKTINGETKYASITKTVLDATVKSLYALKRPCVVTITTDSQLLNDVFNNHKLEAIIKKQWKQPTGEDIKFADLWKHLAVMSCMHDISVFNTVF